MRDAATADEGTSAISSSAQALTRDSATAMAGGLLSQGLKLLTLIYVARRFGPSEFGMIVFALAVNAFIFVVSSFGLPVFGAREVARRRGVSSELLRCVVLSRAVLALLATVVATTILALLPMVSRQELALIAVFGLSNFFLAGLLDWVFQGLARQDVSAILNVIWQSVWLLSLFVATRLGFGLMAVPITMCFGALAAALSGCLWLERPGVLLQEAGTISLLRESWKTVRAGAHLGAGTLLITVLVWTDAIVVRLMLDKKVVGMYAAGSRPANSLVMLCGFYIVGAFPQLSHASLNREQFVRCFQRAYDELALIYVPFSVWGMFYAREIILFLFRRPEYLATVPVFQIFQLAIVVMAINLLYGTGVLLSHHQDRAYHAVLRNTTIAFLALCITLTRIAGMIGTAIAIPVAQTISLMLFMRLGRKIVLPRHGEALLPPLLVSVVAVAFCRLLTLGLWSAVAALLFAYFVLLALRIRAALTEDALSAC